MGLNSIVSFVIVGLFFILWISLLIWVARKVMDYAKDQRFAKEKAEQERNEMISLQREILAELKRVK